MNRRRRWPIALAGIILLSAAAIVGLLDHDASQVTVVYPRDRPAANVEDSASNRRAADHRRGDNSDNADPRADDDAGALTLPGVLPALAPQASSNGAAAVRRAVAAPGQTHFLVDFAALNRSPLARRIMRCRGARAEAGLARLREDFGLDVDRDVDHIGVGSDAVALSGRLGALKLDVAGGTESNYAGTKIVSLPGGQGDRHFARLDDGLVLFADSEAALHAAIDRAQGRAPADDTSLGAADVQGLLMPSDFASLIGPPNDAGSDGAGPPGMATIQALVAKAALRVNVDDHAAISFDLDTAGDEAARDLGKSLGSALTLARQFARNEGQVALEQLLDQARILAPNGGRLGLDLAVPGDWILERLGCDADGNPHPEPTPAVSAEPEVQVEVIAPPSAPE